MNRLKLLALAFLALLLMGAKTQPDHPACTDLEQYGYFVQAIKAKDDIAFVFYTHPTQGCGLILGGFEAVEINRGKNWIRILIFLPDGPVRVYTDPGALGEEI